VTYDGKVQGKTPLDVVMPRRGPDTFTVSLDGYKPHAVKVKAVANGWAVGNIAFLILAPVTYVVDVIAGNELKWSTKPVVVTLESRPASSPAVAKTSP
jgi:hypothetical protein